MKKEIEDPDKYWKWGLFYYNPKDPSLFVDKRFGIGQSMNWAHRKSYYLIIFLILFPLLIMLLVVYLDK